MVLTKAICLPSGVQLMGEAGGPGGKLTGSDHVPEVSRLASPPLAAINQMWVDCEGPVTNESLAPTSNASRNLASPSRFGASSIARKSTRLNSSHSGIPYAVFCCEQ